MLDVFSIFTTTLCVLYVLVRAAALDRTLPWFEEEPAPGNVQDSNAKVKVAIGENRWRGL